MKTLYTTCSKGIAQALLIAAFPAALSAQPVTTPRTPSPEAEVSQTIGISTVTVNYSRPAVHDREVWGALVPYGWNVQNFGAGNEAPWRAGANENTTLTLSDDATVEGKEVPAGTYGLFFVINEDGNTGTVVLSEDNQAWGSYWYDPAKDVMRADIKLNEIAHTERLTYDFINIDRTSADLVLNWEKKQFPVKIAFDVDAIVYENARNELTGSAGFGWQGYSSAANYLLQNNIELEQALKWIDIAIAQNNTFPMLRTKSAILAAMGKTKESESTMNEAVELATEAQLNGYGYQLLNQGKHEKAIEIFAMNTKRHPKSANAWDSLGEAYVVKGDKNKAVPQFKKALTLDPAPNVRANSEKYLKELGAM